MAERESRVVGGRLLERKGGERDSEEAVQSWHGPGEGALDDGW
jgi:hypothetical protein